MSDPLLRRSSDSPAAKAGRRAPLHLAPPADGPLLRYALLASPMLLAALGLGLAYASEHPGELLVVAGMAAAGLSAPGPVRFVVTQLTLACGMAAVMVAGDRYADLPFVLTASIVALVLAAVTAAVRRRDVTALHRARKDLHAAEAGAVLDTLTGLANRQGLLMLAAPMLELARRNGDALHCVVMSVDGLAEANAAAGGRASDDILVAAAGALRAVTRSTDVVARWDGTHFGVVGPGSGMPMTEIERRVRERLMENPPVDLAVWQPKITAGGAVLAPWDEGNVDALLRKANLETSARRAVRVTAARRRTAGTS